MRDPRTGWIHLTTAEFGLIWSAMDLGATPLALDLPYPAATPAKRAAATEALVGRGLGTVDEPAGDVADLLRLVASAPTQVDLCGYDAAGAWHGLGACMAGRAAVVVREEDAVRLRSAPPDAVVASLLGTMAPLPAARGCSANVAAGDYTRACAAGERDGVLGFIESLHASGLRPADAATLARALTTRISGGQLGVTGPGRHGRAVRGASPLTWLDTPAGRYMLLRRGEWITATPADASRMAGIAADLLDDLR